MVNKSYPHPPSIPLIVCGIVYGMHQLKLIDGGSPHSIQLGNELVQSNEDFRF